MQGFSPTSVPLRSRRLSLTVEYEMATNMERVRKIRSTYRRSAMKLVNRVEDALKKEIGKADERK